MIGHEILAFISDDKALITVEEMCDEMISESLLDLDASEICLFNEAPCAYGSDEKIQVKCFPFLLRRFDRLKLIEYLEKANQATKIECAGGYF